MQDQDLTCLVPKRASNRQSISMSVSDSSFDGIRVEFEDDSESDDECTRSGFRDHGRGGDTTGTASAAHSVTSPSIVNSSISTTRLDSGPTGSSSKSKSNSKWVLGVRHLSFASESLNERMAERGKHFSHSPLNSDQRDLRPKNHFVHKRDTKVSVSPMDAIREDAIEPYQTYRPHPNNGNVIYKKNGFNGMKNRSELSRVADRQIATEVNSSKSQQKSETKSVPQLNAHKARDAMNGSELRGKPMANSKPIPKIDYNTEDDNQLSGKESEKRTKNCDKKTKDCDQKQKKSENNLHSINCELKVNNKKISSNFKRSVNSVTLSAQQELQRYKSQRFCETLSLVTIIFGLVLVTITPFLLIPIWVIPNPYSPLIRNFLWLSMLMTILLMTLAALTGNIYWYYDEKKKKWSWFYHCGKGPKDHYWGATLFYNHQPLKSLVKSRTNHISLNV